MQALPGIEHIRPASFPGGLFNWRRCHRFCFASYNNTQIYQFCSLSYKEKSP
nr:MAG TPA: hypothetical protein [Caudoviricetes sp.]